jgi:hypothetical protein
MLGHQIRDPHDSDDAPVVEGLLFCVLVAGPAEVLLCGKGLTILIDPHLASRIWHTIGLGIGGPAVFDPGCMMMSRIETVLNPGIRDGLSP